MSIKNLFGKSFKSYASASADLESTSYADNVVSERKTYLPPIDFASASNFVKYGSAKLYYENSIERIYSEFPYDGSKAEKIQFHQSSSYLDRWMYTEKYPKTTGHITLGTTGYQGTMPADGYGLTTTNEYLRVWGGIHTASSGMQGQLLANTFDKSTKYDLDLNRTQNWRCNPVSGSTIEFWLQVPDWNTTSTGTDRQVILHLDNGVTPGSANGGSLVLEIHRTSADNGKFVLSMKDGASTPAGPLLQDVSDAITDSAFAKWHHYALTIKNGSVGLDTTFYIDGAESKSVTHGSTLLEELPGLLNGYIGALQTTTPMIKGGAGRGKLSGSLDEFRYWKIARTSRQIELNWFRDVGGGMNTDDNVTNLGVYFKFNEGIVGDNNVDNTVLDYSGRIANGLWVGYSSTTNGRSTTSGLELSSHNLTESKDPIIYSSHPDVAALKTEMATSGSNYDSEYQGSFYNSFPNWILEEDGDGNQNLKKLSQILASYFDTLHSQITALSNLNNKEYVIDTYKPAPFAKELLSGKGFITKDLFIDSKIYELYDSTNFDALNFEKNISDIRNLIYLNIYNNLEAIYKSKGTEKSIRNLIRCFGIDDEIIKLNMYTDGGLHYFSDKSKDSSVKKKYIDFDNTSYFSSTMYQTSSVNSDSTFISGSTASANGQNNAFTLEADIVVPYKRRMSEIGYYNTPFISSSIFGFHEAIDTDVHDYTWATSATASLSVWLVRDKIDSRDAHFVVKSADNTVHLVSDYFLDIYDNNHWNMALRVKPNTWPYAGNVVGNPATPTDYTLEFYAANHNFDVLENEVSLSTTISNASGSAFLSNAKRVYAGAHMTNFTGSVIQKSDVQIGAVRGWLDYIDNTSIQQHNKDALNFGTIETYRESNMFTMENKQVSSQELTIFNWDFDTVTGSNSSGKFIVDDTTSGSTDTIYGWIDNIIRREHRAVASGFGTSATDFIDNQYLYALRKELPEISFTNNNVYIKGDKDINFIKDDDVSDNFYMIEKSMNQVVSEEMLKVFSTIQEFANLIGRPVDLYRPSYKRLEKVRQNFFNKVEQDLDLENFITYYKWIDQAVSEMILQLIPASVNFGDGVTDVIDSHMLERNKNQRRIGLLDTIESTEGSARGIEELTYNWKYGHAPVGTTKFSEDTNQNCLWQKDRKERTDISDRERIREVLETQASRTKGTNLATANKTIYQGSTYAIRKLSKPYRVSVEFANLIHGGINYNKQKNREFFKTTILPHGAKGASGAPKNIFGIGLGVGSGLVSKQKCDDIYDPNSKVYDNAIIYVGKFTDSSAGDPLTDLESYTNIVKASTYWPCNIKSGSLTTGYNSVTQVFDTGSTIVNLHSDTIDLTNEISMQGPFTQTHVGGRQNRHIQPNRHRPSTGLDGQYTRPEAWRLLAGDSAAGDGAIGFVGPDYGGPYPDTTRRMAIYYREERAKRPINVRNIQSTITSTATSTTQETTILGNYRHKYEVLNTFGMRDQRFLLRRTPSDLGMLGITTLPQTTQPTSLFAAATSPPIPASGSTWDISTLSIPRPLTDLTGSKSIITTRFSAPGGIDTMSRNYLDITSGEFSAYNSINFRNLSVRGSGSGEVGTIRVNSHAQRREGLRTLLARHCGKFGIDSVHGKVHSTDYKTEASFYKQHRNSLVTPRITNTGALKKAIERPATGITNSGIENNLLNTTLDPNAGFSISFWVRRDSFTADASVVRFNKSSNVAFTFMFDGAKKSKVTFYLTDGTNQTIEWSETVDQKWTFLCVTCDPVQGSIPNLYINSTKATVNTSSIVASAAALKDWNGISLFDSDPTAGTKELEGALSDFAVWKSVLSQTDINKLYADNGIATAHDKVSFLYDYWRLGTEPILSSIAVGSSISGGTSIRSEIGLNALEVQGSSAVVTSGPYVEYGVADEKDHNNEFVVSSLPASEFQYSWINASVSGSEGWMNNQPLRGYAPKDGKIVLIGGGSPIREIPAINFPTASMLYGE